MKKVIVASKNPVKIQATKSMFEIVFDRSFYVVWKDISGWVKDQPNTEEETLLWATNRAMKAFDSSYDVEYWVGIEWWVEKTKNWLLSIGWVVIKWKKMVGRSRTASFFLPNMVAQLIDQWKELWEADDIVFGMTDSKKWLWAVGILTGGVLSRLSLYQTSIIQALIPFKRPDLY